MSIGGGWGGNSSVKYGDNGGPWRERGEGAVGGAEAVRMSRY